MAVNLDICRVCLATDVRMYALADTPLQVVYERLTNSPLVTTDNRPVTACYMCHAQLNNGYNLMMLAAKTEESLKKIIRSNKITKSSVSLIDRFDASVCTTLVVSQFVDVDIESTVPSNDVTTAPVVNIDAVDVQAAVPPINEPTVIVVDDDSVDMDATVPPMDAERVIAAVPSVVKPTVSAVHDTSTEVFEIDWAKDVRVEVKEEPLDVDDDLTNISVSKKQSKKDRSLCDVCHQFFRLDCDLKRHLQSLACNICDYRLKLPPRLRMHTRSHKLINQKHCKTNPTCMP